MNPNVLNQTFDKTFDDWLATSGRWEWFRQFWEHRNDRNLLILKFAQVVKDKKAAAKQLVSFNFSYVICSYIYWCVYLFFLCFNK
jgi:hypothetical protein